MAAHGRGQMLVWGIRARRTWWSGRGWQRLQEQLTPEQAALMEPLCRNLEYLSQQLKEANQRLEAAAPEGERPKGIGTRTLEQIDSEVCDWDRFTNRKQPGSYAGLCGGVEASGESHRDLPITKAGNRRLRAMLVEVAWCLTRWQPQCPLIQRWKDVLLAPKTHARKRKKAIVAVARQLMVDLWRWRTGRVTPEQLGWIMVPAK